jgi:hypothetical protein
VFHAAFAVVIHRGGPLDVMVMSTGGAAVADPEKNLSGGNSNEWGHFKHKFNSF